MTSTDALRLVVVVLALLALAILTASTVLRWDRLPPETRNKGLALFPTYLAVCYGVIEAAHRDLPLNHGLWLMAFALTVFTGVWGYYLIREARD
jgi:hypothetical protein